jgi:hypothetical protein
MLKNTLQQLRRLSTNGSVGCWGGGVGVAGNLNVGGLQTDYIEGADNGTTQQSQLDCNNGTNFSEGGVSEKLCDWKILYAV